MRKMQIVVGSLFLLITASFMPTAPGLAVSRNSISPNLKFEHPSYQTWGAWQCGEGVCYSWGRYHSGSWTLRWKSDYDSEVTVHCKISYTDSILKRSKKNDWDFTLKPNRINSFLYAWDAVDEPEIEITSIDDN